jgi:hypothetical protein
MPLTGSSTIFHTDLCPSIPLRLDRSPASHSYAGGRSSKDKMDKKLHPDTDIAELDTEKPDYIVQGELANDRARFDYDTAQRLKRRADWRMMPLLIVIYLIAKIDSNIVSVRLLLRFHPPDLGASRPSTVEVTLPL